MLDVFAPSNASDLLVAYEPVHNLRSTSRGFVVPETRQKKALSVRALKLLNKMPEEIRSVVSYFYQRAFQDFV